MNRDIAGAMLRAAGHHAVLAEGGAEALALATQEVFDVVLMDVRMPVMDGLEATRRIRALAGAPGRVPILGVTAQVFSELVMECLDAGMDGHLAKPFQQDDLLAAIGTALHAGPRRTDCAKRPAAGAIDEPAVLNRAAFERTAVFLPPEALATYMASLAARGGALLDLLRAAPEGNGDLAAAAHTLAGSAGMFGFERLAAAGRAFEIAVRVDTHGSLPARDRLIRAIEVSLVELGRHSRLMPA
jgi:CheY-like chemotaxis protein